MQNDTDILKKLFSGEFIYDLITGTGITPKHTNVPGYYIKILH